MKSQNGCRENLLVVRLLSLPPLLLYLEAEVLPEDAAVQRLHGDRLPAAQVQALHRAARAQQGLVGAGLLQFRQPTGPQTEKGTSDSVAARPPRTSARVHREGG